VATHQTAEIGAWYINLDGQFLRVWGVAYERGGVSQVVVQQLSGKRSVLDLIEWQLMDLVRYPMGDDAQQGAMLP
jgi:hypothetical protein